MYPVQLVLTESGKCSVFTIFKPPIITNLVLHGVLAENEFLNALQPLVGINCVLCPGIPVVDTKYLTKSVITLGHPFLRTQSQKCPVWYQRKSDSGRGMSAQCLHCASSAKAVSAKKKRKATETPTKICKRSKTDSNYSITRLTPKSLKTRLSNIKKSRRCLKERVTKLEKQVAHKDMLLMDSQSQELQSIVGIVNANFKKDLNELLEQHGDKGKTFREVWERDSAKQQNSDALSFFEDQRFCQNGSNGNRWSSITIRIALAVFCRSPAAYQALKSFKILQLPSVDTLRKKTKKFNESPGINHEYFAEQEEKNSKMKIEHLALGRNEPKSEGILIYDEVKVIEKLVWNSKNHEFIGFAMTEEEYPFLDDIMKNESEKEQCPTEYVLQFFWRDMTSHFDLMGPYFTFGTSVDHDTLIRCILKTIEVLQAYSFSTVGIVCDGASENLATIKLTMRKKGAFDSDEDVTPSFEHPFLANRNIFWIICPSHQLKNMCSALHSSRKGGAKDFHRGTTSLGWKQIEEVRDREHRRAEDGTMRFVPKLLDSYVVRDSWTRLNVKPSKILQQENFLSELYSFGHGSEGSQSSRDSAIECYKYLKACNQIFESGLLSSSKITSSDSPQLKSISTGYKYFKDWLQEVLKNNPGINLKNSKQTSFLSWQTWDLLRVCVSGFTGFCTEFFKHNPECFLVAVRVNGSAVETLFSQFKYATAGKLSGTNYSTARKCILIKSNVHGSNQSNKDYRDVPLYIRQSDL